MTDDPVTLHWAYNANSMEEKLSLATARIEKLEKALRYIAEIKGEIAEEPPEEIGEETHKMWISLILCAVSAEAALGGETK